MKRKITVFLALGMLTIVGCGSSSDGGDDNTTRKDFGLYVMEDGSDSTPLSLTLMKNGTMLLTHNGEASGSLPIGLSGFSVLDKNNGAIDHQFYVYDESRTQQFLAQLSMPRTGSTMGEVLPFTFTVDELGIEISSIVYYFRTEDNPNNTALLDNRYLSANGSEYNYLGNRQLEIQDPLNGCEITAYAVDSGLSHTEQDHYALEVLSSTCESNAHSTGLLTVNKTQNINTLSAMIELDTTLVTYAGIAFN
ncbi:hypothetical protein [Vibrio agarivorans]|uniref:hypothetical protein n=1 Tax=Vibrio agarivorans TaxID=153622 RepID=UPI00222ED6E0|nr:hypothetical protein [Vibrio agarivorans]